jgi:hypothetical protein
VRHATADVFALVARAHGLPLALARGSERRDEAAVRRD